jgi:hypothetical protein
MPLSGWQGSRFVIPRAVCMQSRPMFCEICSAVLERRLPLFWVQRQGRVTSIIESNQANWSTKCSPFNIYGSSVSSSVFSVATRSCRLACGSVAVRIVYSNDNAHWEMAVILEKSCSNAANAGGCAPWILPDRARESCVAILQWNGGRVTGCNAQEPFE